MAQRFHFNVLDAIQSSIHIYDLPMSITIVGFNYECGNDLTLSNLDKLRRAKLLSHVFIFDTGYCLTK